MTTSGSRNPNLDLSAAVPDDDDDDDEDRLSRLPEEILHRILSFLYTTQVIKTSLLSTRWKNLWKSHPFISLHFSSLDKDSRNSIYVDHFLRLRDSNSSNIQRLRLDCNDEPNLDLLHQCIVTAAVNQRAEEIDIMVWPSHSDYIGIDLNPDIFAFGVVRVFKFAEFRNEIPVIRFPNSICYSVYLKFLKIYGIRLPLGDSNQQLQLICPNLETLIIKDCHYSHLRVLDISAPQLHKLVIFNPVADAILGPCILGIHTPKLSSFRYYGSSFVDYSFMEKFPFLATVHITLLALTSDQNQKDQALYRYVKLLNGLWNVKNLSVEGFVGRFAWVPNMLNKELHFKRFTTLKNLKLRSTHEMSSIQGMAYLLLNSCALVENFEWEICNQYYATEIKVEEYLMLPEVKLCCLKLVKVGRLQGHMNELVFLKFLVKSAIVLEEMIITTRASLIDSLISSEEVENRRQFKEALTELPWSSPYTMAISKYETIITLEPPNYNYS